MVDLFETPTIYLSDTQVLKLFDCSETAGISARWDRSLQALELFVTGKGVKNAGQKKALLLHTTGSRVQDIYFALKRKEDRITIGKRRRP